MQNQLTMGKENPFRVTGRPRGIEGRGHRIFIKIRKIEFSERTSKQLLVFAEHFKRCLDCLLLIGDLDISFHRRQLVFNLSQQRDKIIMHQHNVIFGMVHGVDDLLRSKTNIHRMQHRANHRNREKALEVAWRIPIKHSDGIALFHAGFSKYIRKPLHALIELSITVTFAIVTPDNFIVATITLTREK